MTTNADRKTPYEYETTNGLIAEVRRLRADNIAPQSSRNRLVALTEQLADALEAAIEAERDAERRFTAMLDIEASLRLDLEASQAREAELNAALEWESKPADLLAAVDFIVSVADAHAIRTGIDFPTHRATLRRYGLLPAAPMEDASAP